MLWRWTDVHREEVMVGPCGEGMWLGGLGRQWAWRAALGLVLVAGARLPAAMAHGDAPSSPVAAALPDGPVRVCAPDQPLPPYTYATPAQPRPQGLAVQMVQQLLKDTLDKPMLLELMPMAQCLQHLEQGHVQLAMDMPTARVDPQRVYATQPYAQVSTVYVYAKARHPHGLPLHRLADLRRLKVCILQGFPVEDYLLDSRQVDQSATQLEALLAQVQQGRCDAALVQEDVLDHLGLVQPALARWLRQAKLKAEKVPQDSPVSLHLLVGRQWAGGERVYVRLNERLRQLQRQGLLPLRAPQPGQEP